MPLSDVEDLLSATRGSEKKGIVDKHISTLSEEDQETIDSYLKAAFDEDLPLHSMAKVLTRRFAFPCSLQTMTKWLNERKQAERS